MKIISEIWKHSDKTHWKDATVWFLWSIVCGLIPLWGTQLVFYLTESTASYYKLLDDGEFMLYTAAYLGGAFYVVIRDFKSVSFPSRELLAIFMVILLLISTVTYSLITVDVVPQPSSTFSFIELFNDNAITRMSLIVLPLTMFITFMIMVAENIRLGVNLADIRKQDYDELNKNFDELGDG